MKKLTHKLLPVLSAFLVIFSLFSGTIHPAPASATANNGDVSNTAQTAILKSCAEDDGAGWSIICLLQQAVSILSVVVGVVGAIGITVVGIQYLTAGGNEEQTRKAKRRLFEIVIGLAVYALISALLTFLLPNFSGSS
ncbi:hypothetical protein IJG96_01055 [Candidatus Saccharibacteria bacterium]|nr:hypothetical protein [Candidatus Saccharibacteria bacterium]